jgi:hypothetical protein
MTRVLRRGEGSRLAGGLLLVVGLAFAPRAAEGYERVHTLRWTQPSGAEATGFAVALGTRSGQYGETRDLGAVAPGSDGVHRADLVVDSFSDYFVVLTAYNGAGSSPQSNEVLIAKAACDATFCEDGNACTADACGTSACTHQALPDGTACAGAAGPGLCAGGTCQAVECLAHADCGDGNACNGVEVCAGSRCQAGTPPSCGGETACTLSGCDAALGCVTRNKADGTACNDGNPATTADRCTAGVCAGTPETAGGGGGKGSGSTGGDPTCNLAACEDGNPCTTHSCHLGACVIEPAADGAACDDGNAATVADMCSAAVCSGTPDVVGPPVCQGLSCDDANACTADACTESGCTHIALADGTVCDDGNRRTHADTCRAGVCAGREKREFSHGKWWGSRKWWDKPTARKR